jgi:hypothetical protein
MFYTRYVTLFALYSTQDHQKSSLFTSVTAISLQVQHVTCAKYGVSTSVWPMYTAGIDLGQLMHVSYPLCNLICAIFNSRPSEELTFHLNCLLLFRCRCSMRHARDMAYQHRRVANIYSWDRFRATHACFIPAV